METIEQTTTSIPKEKSKQERLFLTKQGNFVTEWDIKKAAQIIFNQNLTQINFDQFITNCLGIDAELDPDMDTLSKIKILLRHGEIVRAIRLYYNDSDKQKTTLKEARDAIYQLEATMKQNGELL